MLGRLSSLVEKGGKGIQNRATGLKDPEARSECPLYVRRVPRGSQEDSATGVRNVVVLIL